MSVIAAAGINQVGRPHRHQWCIDPEVPLIVSAIRAYRKYSPFMWFLVKRLVL